MRDLLSSDICGLLSAVSELNHDLDSRDVSLRVMSAIEMVVPTDLIAIDSFGETAEQPPTHWNNNAELLTPEIGEICVAVFDESPHDNPLINELVHNGNGGVLKLSDFDGEQRFRETAYFREIMLRLDQDRQIGMMLPAAEGLSFGCAINRKGKDFTERERQILTLLAPHLSHAIALAHEKEKRAIIERRFTLALDARSTGLIVMTTGGKLILKTELAQRLLEKYFTSRTGGGGELPEPLARWIEKNQEGGILGEPPRPISVELGDATLRVTLRTDTLTREVTLQLEETHRPGPSMLEALGLTARQAEILYWICKGKTDETIAQLTGISRRTVEKHAENIFQRLGVESRTAAAAAATERLSFLD